MLLAHPLHVMAFAVTDAPFDPHTIPESYILLRDTQKADFSEIYSDPDAASKLFSARTPAVIFKNDCVVTTGAGLLQAFDRLEVAEATAHSIISARDAGEVVYIKKEELDDLKVAFRLED